MSRLFDGFSDGGSDDRFNAPSFLTPPGGVREALGDGESALDRVEPLESDALGAELGSETRGEALVEPEAIPDEGELELPPPYEIPDFEKDERDLGVYEDAKRRYLRQMISSAENAIQTSFSQKREQLQKEIKNARSFEDERRASALHTTRQYANRYPHHVDKRGISPPSFFENLFSFGRAGRLYRAAFVAGEALEALRTAIRKRDEALGALESQLSRALYLKEEQIKKSMETDAGLNEFHERPEIKPIYLRVEKIRKERESFAARLEAGEVTDEEQRDRGMAEHKLTYAELPLTGTIIAKIDHFGNLTYFRLRDLERTETLLSYDSRLDGLRNAVFDVYAVAGTVAAKIRRNDNGTAFRVADHFKACWRNQDQAEEMYSQHRAALREDRGLAPMTPRNDAEAEILERLAALATAVEGGSGQRPGFANASAQVTSAPTVRP